MGGDGIGPECVDAALQVLDVAAAADGLTVDLSEDLLGGASWDEYGTYIRPETLEKARQSDALLVGAVGGPQWDHIVIEGGPEEQDGLMKLRHELQTFACMRHARAHDALLDRTAFRPERIRGADIMVMRELCGGAMFTPTRGIEETDEGRRDEARLLPDDHPMKPPGHYLDMVDDLDRFLARLADRAPRTLTVDSLVIEGEYHATAPWTVLTRGLRRFPPRRA